MELSVMSAGAAPHHANVAAGRGIIVSGPFSCSGALLSSPPSRPRPSQFCPSSAFTNDSAPSSSSSCSSSSSFHTLSSSSCNRRNNDEFRRRNRCTEFLVALCHSPHAHNKTKIRSSSMLRSLPTLSHSTFRCNCDNSVAHSARRSPSSTLSCSASASVPSEEIVESSVEDSQDQQQQQESQNTKEEGEGEKKSQGKKPGAFRSSWDAKDSEGKDYLYRLGKESDNLNVTVGARKGMIDDVFIGDFLGKESDIVFQYRQKVTRSLKNVQGDYYIAPAFMETVVTHITKNYLAPYLDIEVPLILGVWGGKGQGKSFQLELICKALGMEPVIMSAGELESEWAGEPGRLIRDRYRTASKVIKVQGKMSALVINDLDAGIGRFDNTQCTVNNQMVVGSLMNLADNPTRVSIGQEWREADIVNRVPIIITGNDLSTIYAPLVRDGRMDKFYWKPTREDIVNIVHHMYRKDGLSMEDISTVVDRFPNQALDFYGALRSRLYDREIVKWIEKVGGIEKLGAALVSRKRSEESVPAFVNPEPSLEKLLQAGESLVQEQQMVKKVRLSEEYMKTMKAFKGGGGLSMLAS